MLHTSISFFRQILYFYNFGYSFEQNIITFDESIHDKYDKFKNTDLSIHKYHCFTFFVKYIEMEHFLFFLKL